MRGLAAAALACRSPGCQTCPPASCSRGCPPSPAKRRLDDNSLPGSTLILSQIVETRGEPHGCRTHRGTDRGIRTEAADVRCDFDSGGASHPGNDPDVGDGAG